MFKKEIFMKRRELLSKNFQNEVIIFIGNSESPTTYGDNCYDFIQDSTFLYYFGLNKADLIGVIDREESIIFGKEYTMDDIIWMGNQASYEKQSESVGCKFRDIDELEKYLEGKKILYLPQYRSENKEKLAKILKKDYFKINKESSKELIDKIVSQREIKSEEEIEEIEKAVNITRDMHFKAMEEVKAGMKVYELVTKLENEARKVNAKISFRTICTNRGQILHNELYNDMLKDGEIVLLDCGAKVESGYCGDMTTVFPVNGKFSDQQKEIYEILIKMFDRAVELIKPGVFYKAVHLEVCKVLAGELKKIGILNGDVDEIVKNGVHALFLPHGLGHMLGLDVHDMENFGEDNVGYDKEIQRSEQFGLSALRMAKRLKPGHVITVEPGIYFIPELIKKWKKEKKYIEYINYKKLEEYMNFSGMRYEGDFLVTLDGNRRLGKKMPKKYEEIEKKIKKYDKKL